MNEHAAVVTTMNVSALRVVKPVTLGGDGELIEVGISDENTSFSVRLPIDVAKTNYPIGQRVTVTVRPDREGAVSDAS